MLHAVVIDSGVTGTQDRFVDSEDIRYRFEPVTADWSPRFSERLVIAPNGSNQLALYHAREAILDVLAKGGIVLSFCGCFMPWLPGTRWVHDNAHANREIRYNAVNDPLDLLHDVDVSRLATNAHGISGWWACGGLRTRHADQIVLADTWGRAVLVADHRSSAGIVVATASGPLCDDRPYEADDGGPRTL